LGAHGRYKKGVTTIKEDEVAEEFVHKDGAIFGLISQRMEAFFKSVFFVRWFIDFI